LYFTRKRKYSICGYGIKHNQCFGQIKHKYLVHPESEEDMCIKKVNKLHDL